jgi:phospholipase/lecithinase/hemolysin
MFETLFAFGDSLSDAGNDWIADGHTDPVSPYFNGHFSNGLTWVEDLSQMLGLGTLTPSLAGGHDFAFGGAETGPTAIEGADETNPPWRARPPHGDRISLTARTIRRRQGLAARAKAGGRLMADRADLVRRPRRIQAGADRSNCTA